MKLFSKLSHLVKYLTMITLCILGSIIFVYYSDKINIGNILFLVLIILVYIYILFDFYKRFGKFTGIFLLSIFALLIITMFTQWLFFSYNEDDFDIPKNYFDRMYEDEEIDSEENGFKEYFSYLYGITEDLNLNGTESQEKFYNETKNLTKLEKLETSYYSEKFQCKVSNRCEELNNNVINDKYKYRKEEVDLKDLEYNGEKFNEMVNYFEEKYKLFEKIKSKKYIKYNGRNEEIYLIENNYNKSDSNEQRETSGIAIIYIENGEYEKGIDLLVKQREIIDTIQKKMYINNLLGVISQMAISNINYSTIEYVLENYLNIPSHLLEKLLSELEKPVREGIAKEGHKAEFNTIKDLLTDKGINKSFKVNCLSYGYAKDHIFWINNKIIKTIIEIILKPYSTGLYYDINSEREEIIEGMYSIDGIIEQKFGIVKPLGCYMGNKILSKLFYSSNETIALYKEMMYNLNEFETNSREEIYENSYIIRELSENYISFFLKNINNFIGRIIVRQKFISKQDYSYNEKRIQMQRQSLIQTLQERISSQKEKEVKTNESKADILKVFGINKPLQ